MTPRTKITTLLAGIGGWFLMMAILCPNFAWGQRSAQNGKEIQAMKIAFFTNALHLTPGESEKFWPVYNQYWDQVRALGRQRRTLLETIQNGTSGEKELREWEAILTAELALTHKYSIAFREVLPIEKVVRVFVADENFKNYLIRQAAERVFGEGER